MKSIVDYLERAMRASENSLGALIRELRLRSRKSGREFAKDLGVGHFTVRRWERGLPISRPNLQKIADAAGVPIERVDSYLAGLVSLKDLLPEPALAPSSNLLEQMKSQAERLSRRALRDLIIYLVNLLFNYGERGRAVTIRSQLKELLRRDPDNEGLTYIDANRREALLNGDRPTDEEMPLLAAALGVSLESLMEIRDKEFS